MAALQHQSLANDGIWRVAAIGATVNHTPSADNPSSDLRFLVKLRAPPHTPSTPDAVDCFPIGELPLFFHEAVIVDKYIVKDSEHQANLRPPADEELDFSPHNLRIIKRLACENGELIIPPGKREPLPVDDEFNCYFVAVGKGGDPYSVIIPATEVIRFFYSTTATFTKVIFGDKILDPHSHLFYQQEIDANGHAFFRIRKRMKNVDARYLARFAFSSYALKQAKNIYLFWAVRKAMRNYAAVSAVPPIDFPARTEFLYRQIKTPTGSRKLVVRLLRCHCPAPYKTLDYCRENDGTVDEEDGGEKELSTFPPTAKIDVPTDEPLEMLDGLAPAHGGALTDYLDPSIDDRFPLFRELEVNRVPRDSTKTQYDKNKPSPIATTAAVGSVIDPTANGGAISKADIKGSDKDSVESPPEEADREPELTNQIDTTLNDYGHDAVIQKLKWIEQYTQASIAYKTVLNSYSVVSSVPVNVYPSMIDGRQKRWLFTDDDRTKRRFAIVAEVTHNQKVRYVLELQQVLGKQQCSTIIFWNENESSVSDIEIKRLLISCGRLAKAALASAEVPGISWGRLHHSRSTAMESNKETADHFLIRIGSAKPAYLD